MVVFSTQGVALCWYIKGFQPFSKVSNSYGCKLAAVGKFTNKLSINNIKICENPRYPRHLRSFLFSFVFIFEENSKQNCYNKRISGKNEPDGLPIFCAVCCGVECLNKPTANAATQNCPKTV